MKHGLVIGILTAFAFLCTGFASEASAQDRGKGHKKPKHHLKKHDKKHGKHHMHKHHGKKPGKHAFRGHGKRHPRLHAFGGREMPRAMILRRRVQHHPAARALLLRRAHERAPRFHRFGHN